LNKFDLQKQIRERQAEIHEKGFNMGSSLEFGRMNVGKKTL
jgi:hypothetical protein